MLRIGLTRPRDFPGAKRVLLRYSVSGQSVRKRTSNTPTKTRNSSESERDAYFVELGRYLEVGAGQYWRLDNLRSLDEYLDRELPELRRNAYYLMAIHKHLPKIPKPDPKLVGWTKATEPGCTKLPNCGRKG